jgi:hypothetical protein
MIDRRALILMSVPMVAALSAHRKVGPARPDPSSPQFDERQGSVPCVELKIRGWSSRGRISSCGFIEPSVSEEVFITIGQSWRTAWR